MYLYCSAIAFIEDQRTFWSSFFIDLFPQAEKEVLLSCVQEILEAIDENNDGEITREEFVENARKSSFIKDLIGED